MKQATSIEWIFRFYEEFHSFVVASVADRFVLMLSSDSRNVFMEKLEKKSTMFIEFDSSSFNDLCPRTHNG